MILFNSTINYAYKIKLTQLLFEKKYLEEATAKLPLNEFILDMDNACYVPINMRSTKEVRMPLEEYKKLMDAGYIEVLENDKPQ